MNSLKEKIMMKEKSSVFKRQKNSIIIQIKNSCHIFKISFKIQPINSIPEELQPKNLYHYSVDEIMVIQAELLNKDESFFNENNEEIEIYEKYYEIYSFAELKNNIKGTEWFTELIEFKDAFLDGINRNNFEILIIKNILLFNINIINIFGENKDSHLILRPFEDKKILPNSNSSLISDNFLINSQNNLKLNKIKNKFVVNKNDYKSLNVDFNIKNDITKNNSHKFLAKKRLSQRLRKKHKLPENENNISTNNTNSLENYENIKENNNKENENNIGVLINNFIQDLTKNHKNTFQKFEKNGLINNSKIIKDIEEEKLIGDMISSLNSKIKTYRLLFRATIDGDSAEKFHSTCDSYNNLIILIETQEGLRFGGYTSSKFKDSSHYKLDNNAFLFSLDLKKVFTITSGKYAIYCYDKSGPCFSQGSLYIPNNFFKKYGKTGIAGGPYQFEKDYELNNGKEKFLVKELEIFQVKIEDVINTD